VSRATKNAPQFQSIFERFQIVPKACHWRNRVPGYFAMIAQIQYPWNAKPAFKFPFPEVKP
jgi:hypothetical protein